ncbi:MAG: ATP-binding cassette domain-containing protein [Candidatus Cloacimonadaceae bacterium]
MTWKIAASVYEVWKNFSLEVKEDLILNTGETYHLIGANGAGKTSFLKQILIPQLQSQSDRQYIFYLEQQTQNQLDAVKAYSALQKTAVEILDFEQMLNYLTFLYQKALTDAFRPLLIISDENPYSEKLAFWLEKLNRGDYCLIYVSHGICAFDQSPNLRNISLTLEKAGQAKLTLL